MIKRFKLSCTKYEFHFQGTKTLCTCVFSSPLGFKTETEGMSWLSEGDIYSEKKGMRLARARAEKIAFSQYRGWLQHTYIPRELNKLDRLNQTVDDMNGFVRHQNEYIKIF